MISDGVVYSVNKLIEISKSLEPTEVAIAEFEKAMKTECWDDSEGRKIKPKEVLETIEKGDNEISRLEDHIKRIKESNTAHPILAVNLEGELIVLDGVHRLVKSFLEKKASVPVITFDVLPEQAKVKHEI